MFKAPRGTADILPQDQPYWRHIEAVAAAMCERFGYRRIDTPVFEEAGLFVRSVGESTDVVEKETYTFEDRSKDSMTLRPEGTAPVCRAYLEHGMHVLPQPVRLYSVHVPMFRYDRPQAGRQRQFHQINCEAIGVADAAVDAEVVELAWCFFEALGLKSLSLIINSIGDPKCRPGYLEKLRAYYAPLLERLCGDCKRRYETNVLRLLDCKKESCQPHVANAPKSVDSLCDECRAHWDSLRSYLESLGLPYAIDHRLVRGLDYYTRTVFEVTPPEEGAQSTLGGGGRYDGLIEQLGGPPTPSVGFACGVERIILNLKRQGIEVPPLPPVTAVVAFMGEAAKAPAVKLASDLRRQGVEAVLAPAGKSLKAQLRYATALGASKVLILGDDEVRAGTVAVKDMATGEQKTVAVEEAHVSLRPPLR
ncbi:MAG: histidine--tRNA ligase [Chloroflexi bacterium]|nr:histidine--tRNA ligase [Chloroflexota bacterium]